jgi:hypothetical protein
MAAGPATIDIVLPVHNEGASVAAVSKLGRSTDDKECG